MGDDRSPEMSVVLITPDRYETIRGAVAHLRKQTARDRLEIVIVGPSGGQLALNQSELEGFASFQVVEAGALSSSAEGRAAGVRRATAPIVAFVEDHSFPDPTWAEALIETHRQPWMAVGPAMANANPRGMVSWVNFLLEYGSWMDPIAAGCMDHLPGHNGSYKREVLLGYGSKLTAMLEAESVLHWDLRAKGHQLYLEPGAKTFHWNFSVLPSSMPLRFNGGRAFAAQRAGNGRWSPLRRLCYALGAPLIPPLRMWRIMGELMRPGRPAGLGPRVFPFLLVGLAVDALGEMAGYALGSGDAERKLYDMEFHRCRYLTKRDRQEMGCE